MACADGITNESLVPLTESSEMFSGTKNKWLVLVVVAVFAAFVVACGTDDETKSTSNDGSGGAGAQPTQEPIDSDKGDPAPTDPGFEVVEVLAPIESIQILVLESFPEQYVVQVISGLPNGCATYSRNEVVRDGNTINISVYNTVPAPDDLKRISCIAMYGLHDENIGLGSDFDRDTQYTVIVNERHAGYFQAGVAGTIPIEGDPPIGDALDFVVEPAPVESLEIIIGEDSRWITTYYASVVWGLTNGCKESLDPNVVHNRRQLFAIYPVVTSPTGEVACTDDYRTDSAQIELGVVGQDLVSCTVYTVTAGEQTTEFQAIAPNVRCADPGAATPTPAPPTRGGSVIADSQALEFSLEAQGADVEFGGASEFSMLFGIAPSELKVNGQAVQIYQFAPGTSAEEASESVSLDGTSFVNPDGSVTTVMWIAPPHFYLFGNTIILYVGNDPEIGVLLDSVAGKFAGSDFEGADSGTGEADSEYTIRVAQIERVDIASTRSIPAQFLIGMTIALGGSCEEFAGLDWRVEGREIIIDVTTKVPTAPVPCTLAIIYEDQSVNIGDKYETGAEYDVIVNGERHGTFIGG